MEGDNLSVEQEVKRQVKLMMARVSFADDPESTQPKRYRYNPESIMPFLHFLKLLALRPCDQQHKYRLKLNLPDTVIFNDKDAPLMWLFTNSNGEVVRVDNSAYFSITSRFTEGALQRQCVAVLKKPEYGYGGMSGNDVKVVSAGEVKTVLSQVLSTRNEVSVLQRFVKSSRSKPSILRTVWRKNGHHQAWVLSSNYEYDSKAKVNEVIKFIVNTKMVKAFNAVRCGSEKHMKETLGYVASIAKWIQRHLKASFSQLVCDFIRDEGGNWWYINTRAFVLEGDAKIEIRPITMHDDIPEEGATRKKLQAYTRCRKCRYCYKMVAEHLMSHRLTLLMLLQCDQNLLKMGKSFPWLQRAYSQHVGTVNLYVQHKVCDSCYRFYKEIERLVQLQTRLAELTGVPIPSDNRNAVSITSLPYFKGQSAQFGTRLQPVKYEAEMPQGWQLPPEANIKIQLANEQSTLQKYRLMVYIHGIRDIPPAYKENPHKYSLRYSLLGQQIRYKLDLSKTELGEEGMLQLRIDKIRLLHLFVEKREQIRDYLKANPTLTLELYQDEERLGISQLQLDDFRSDKVIRRDYFKMFSGKKIFPYLSWGLFVSLGLHSTGNTSPLILRLSRREGLLLPDPEYHSADPLPEDWVAMIREKPDRAKNKNETESSEKISNRQKTEGGALLREEIEKYIQRGRTQSGGFRRKPYY